MIILLGAPGVGKSSVLAGIKEKRPEYSIVNYGDLMLETFKQEYNISDRDQMRKSSIEQQKNVQKQVAIKLSAMSGKVILDTHCSVQTPKGYLPGLPFELLKNLNVERLILLSADIDEIYNRRKKDPTRTRETNKEEIQEHDQMNKAYLAAYSAFAAAPAIIVMNHDNRLADAVEKVNALLD
ncbi:adenylate kinase [Candidatus Micrarchaeota archaeon]|nr:adenylate kinase [Candidatus Micrarchaeota archaeon]